MIKQLVINLLKSKRIVGTFPCKMSTFLTLTRLQFKSKIFRNKNSVVSESFYNFKMQGYDFPTLNYLFNEIFISNEYYFQPSSTEPIIIDCGANIGMSVLYFKKLFPSSHIIAFEANPHVFKLLEQNMEVNSINNVLLHNVALYDHETEISFFIGDNIGTLGGSINKDRGGANELKVRTEKLSQYLKKYESVDLIKMDVEGAELNIIADLMESSSINIAKEYIIEYHHNMNDSKSNLSAFLQQFELNGFNYNIRTNFNTINSFQDILIHFYKK